MAETFIPDIWSRRILDQLDKYLVAEQICNNLWEGDIKQAGDSVKIWTPGSITVKPYIKDTDHATADTTTGTDQTMTIDQQKYFNFQIDAITEAQMPVNVLNAYMDRAIYAMRDNIDAHVLGLYTGVAAANTQTPTAVLSSSNVYTECLSLYRKMTDAKIALDGRYLVVSPRVLEQMNAYLAGRATSLGDQVNVNGYVGKFAGFNIYVSHNVVESDEDMTGTASTEVVHNCLAGTTEGIVLAKQIPLGTLKMYDPELRFAKAVKGLMVYGSKMLDSGARNGLLQAWFTS